VQDLNLGECALIAAMPKAPSRYSPLVDRDLAEKRRNIVLKQMFNSGIISASAYRNALAESIIVKSPGPGSGSAPYFVEYVKKFLEETFGSTLVYKGGLTVFTTLSDKLQNTAEQALANGLSALENRMEKKGIKNPDSQGALIALNVESGGVLAMVGGKDFLISPFNRAISARRQPGSAFKPIVYAQAIERGFPQNKLIRDAPVVFKGAQKGKDWRPENFSKTYQGEMTLRKALAISQNIPAVRLIETLGPTSVAQFAHALGIESALEPNLSLALGTSGLSLIELTSAYAVFANRGKRVKPFAVNKIIDDAGRILWLQKPQSRIAMSRTGAAIITNMLEGVIQEGTGKKARSIRKAVAGKTGTTNDFRDALFIGFSPSIATGVWVGRDDFAPLGKWETGAKAALPIWIEFMEKALSSTTFQYFDIPDDVVRVPIDKISGRIASGDSADTVKALFKRGTEPGR
jgi:penicillin-binding protein 1A